MNIVDIKATTVSVPLEAPLRHANGAHWGRFVRTIVEVVADNGLGVELDYDKLKAIFRIVQRRRLPIRQRFRWTKLVHCFARKKLC